jgi:beta-lactamase regulating signal transducer with metallopeptidase domain
MNLDLLSGRVVAALVEGGYQGLLIIAAVWIALKLSRRSNAATRYAAWSATLLIVAALPVLHFVYPPEIAATETSAEAPSMVAIESETLPPMPVEAHMANAIEVDAEVAETDLADLVALNEGPASLAHAHDDVVGAGLNSTENAAGPVSSESLLQRASAGFAWPAWQLPRWSWSFSLPPMVGLILVFAWASLSVARLVGLAGQVCLLRGLKQRATAAPAQLLAPFCALVKKLGLTRAPRLLITPDVDVPMVAGFARPAVLIPEHLLEVANDAQLEHIFRHELAHVARGDDWVNLLQQALGAVFFFHPGVHFVSRRMSVEREIACDDHALAAIKAPKEYALFLTEFAGRMTGRGIAAAPAAWSNRSQLKERITMILDGKRNASPRLAGARAVTLTAGAVLLAALTMAVAPRVALAEPASAITLTSADGDSVLLAEVPPSGPREKSDVRVEVHVDAPAAISAPAALPAPPAPPADPAALPTPAPKPLPAPRVRIERTERVERPDRPERAERGDRDESLERRLERLERLVEKLSKGEKSTSHSESRTEIRTTNRDSKDPTFEWRGPKPEELAKIREEANRAAERARDDMKRAPKDMDMNIQMSLKNADSAVKNEEWKMAFNTERQAIKARREALENQRRVLEKQIESLDREMEQKQEAMQREREKRDEERQRERDREHEKRDKERRESKEKAEKDSPKEKSKDKDDGKNKNADINENSAGNAAITLQKF